ncbi:MAG TPA: PDDEXK nuclease domain-containing protein [Thermoanaerobaculia bacterium]|nr:PDDEXK nuclease domain-containing protein [Thermoanaerobaculia bacterium]
MAQKKTTAGTSRSRIVKQPVAVASARKPSRTAASPAALLSEVRELILQTRKTVAQGVNSALVLLYWQIGQRIRIDILKEKRAGYGEQIFHSLSGKLTAEFGGGYTERNLANMVRCAEVFPDRNILHTLCAKLSWSHFRRLIYVDDPLKREFYAEMCRVEQWSVRTLHERIQSMLFERTALSKKPDSLIAAELKMLRDEDKLSPDLVFRDPYVLDFLGLKDTFGENDLEAAILREIEAFILEIGVGFCFVERQKRMQIDGRDYYLDLLFYHRKLRRLVAVELKVGDFEAADKGQMELYLNWLKRHERERDEDEPLGMILCAGKSQEHVELLELQKSGIHLASYLTTLLPWKQLETKLREAVKLARQRLQEPALGVAQGRPS